MVVRSSVREVEPAFGSLKSHHRRQRSDGLAVFHAVIEDLSSAWITWVGNDRAVPERARSSLRRPLEYRHHAVARSNERHEVGNPIPFCGPGEITDDPPSDVVYGIQRRSDLRLGRGGAAIEGVL